jgi:hypothetical protein
MRGHCYSGLTPLANGKTNASRSEAPMAFKRVEPTSDGASETA